MRLEVFEFVMLVMLAREGRRCGWGFALGVARLASFSLSGVACLEAEDGLGMVVEERGVGVREAMEVRRQDAHADAGPDELMRRTKGGPTHPLRLSRVREREYVCVCECVCECVGVCFPWKIRRDASLCCFSRRVLFFFPPPPPFALSPHRASSKQREFNTRFHSACHRPPSQLQQHSFSFSLSP